MTRVKNVNCIGDSFVAGYGDKPEYIGWAGRLRRDFITANECPPGSESSHTVASFNVVGMMGASAVKLARSPGLASELALRVRNHPTVNMVSVGINDAVLRANGEEFSTVDQFAENMNALYDTLEAQKGDTAPLYVGFNSFNDELTMPYMGQAGYYERDRCGEFEAIAVDLAERRSIRAVPLFEATDTPEFQGSMLSADGLHPNAEGYYVIYERVKQAVEPLLG